MTTGSTKHVVAEQEPLSLPVAAKYIWISMLALWMLMDPSAHFSYVLCPPSQPLPSIFSFILGDNQRESSLNKAFGQLAG